MPNLHKNLLSDVKKILECEGYNGMINVTLGNDSQVSRVPENEATEISIIANGTEKETLWKRIKLPKKKLVTSEYILTRLNNDKVYQSFATKFKKLLDKTDLKNSFSLYPTTYGMGLHNLFNRNKFEIKTKVENILNELGIKYITEYSEAKWVLRFKISKSAENIKRIKEM